MPARCACPGVSQFINLAPRVPPQQCRDLALEGADQEAGLWRAGATECSAVHRHKAATLAAAARSRAAAAAAPRGSGGGTSTAGVADPAASAAAEVAAWAAANAAVVLELQGRIQAVLR